MSRKNQIIMANRDKYLWLLTGAIPLGFMSKSLILPTIYSIVGYQLLTHKLTHENT